MDACQTLRLSNREGMPSAASHQASPDQDARTRTHLEELAARDALLDDHTGNGDHGEAAVVELLGLHLLELRGVGRLEAERVEAEVVARDVLRLHRPRGLRRRREVEGREDLRDGDGEDDRRPEGLQRRLLEGGERRRVVAREERVELLGQREADGRKHRHARVLDLDLAVELDLALRRLGAEAERVEEAKRARDAREALGELDRVERRRRLGHGRGLLHGEAGAG
eukprot:scaffold18105_cov60-Phaeocystis_antarctica.AAC.3